MSDNNNNKWGDVVEDVEDDKRPFSYLFGPLKKFENSCEVYSHIEDHVVECDPIKLLESGAPVTFIKRGKEEGSFMFHSRSSTDMLFGRCNSNILFEDGGKTYTFLHKENRARHVFVTAVDFSIKKHYEIAKRNKAKKADE